MKKLVTPVLIGFCVIFASLALQPEMAYGDDEALWREIRALREEIAELREDLQLVLSFIGLWAIDGEDSSYSAEADDVVSDLRMMKTASLMFFIDNMDEAQNLPRNVNLMERLRQYMDNPDDFDSGLHFLKIVDDEWWVGYDLEKAGKNDDVRERLSEMAETIGLYGDTNLSAANYANQGMIWMIAR